MGVGARRIEFRHGFENHIDQFQIHLLVVRNRRGRRGVGDRVGREDQLHAIAHAIVEMQARAKAADEALSQPVTLTCQWQQFLSHVRQPKLLRLQLQLKLLPKQPPDDTAHGSSSHLISHVASL